MEENKDAVSGNVYEFGYLLVGSLVDSDVPAKVGSLKDFFESKGAKFIAEEFPRHINLAYEMAKSVENKKSWYKEGYFGWMKFELDPAIANEITPELRRDNLILRFLMIRTVRESTIAGRRGLTRGEYKRPFKKTEVVQEPSK